MNIKQLMPGLFLFLTLGFYAQEAKKITVNGYVMEKGSKETLPGVNIYAPRYKLGTTANSYGYFSISLPKDTAELIFSLVGYQPKLHKVFPDSSHQLNIYLENTIQLQEVTITAEKKEKVSEEVQMSSIEIPVEQIKEIPTLLGEKDVLKVIQLLPGVKKGSEGNSGFYVRGGGPDQNLILLDEAPVYNASHLFGFFSIFNGNALKSVELIKGGFPARYGGRLSSVLDIQMKDGDMSKLKGEAGIGVVASHFTLEGPIKKDKSSFIVSGRRTYIDALVYPFLPAESKAGYYFYDLNAKVNYIAGPKDRIFLSGYLGNDKFYMNPQNGKMNIAWGNKTANLRWNHILGEKMFSNLSLIFSEYKFGINQSINETYINSKLNMFSGINDLGFKYNLDFHPNTFHSIKTGIQYTRHRFTPQAIVIIDESSPSFNSFTETISHESAAFIEDDWKISQKLRGNFGFRLSNLSVQNTHYLNPEPRASLRYLIKDDFSVKLSYATMNQFVHLLSNSGIGLPTDLWLPTTGKVKPQQSNQVALGIAKDFIDQGLTLTIEGYYKTMKNVVGYKEGASFMFNAFDEQDQATWEDELTTGKSKSYGGELFLQKKSGKFTGWVGYTLSWTLQQFDELNFGKEFYAKYDRRHDISIVSIYKINEHTTLSAVWVYGTGNAITLPVSIYSPDVHLNVFNSSNQPSSLPTIENPGAKNSFRMEPYHRLDLGIQFHKKLKRCERTIELSAYNAYNHMNPYYYYVSKVNNKTTLMQVTLFPIIPSISWNYKF